MRTLAALLDADEATQWEHPRDGKRVTVWEEMVTPEGFDKPVRRVLRLTERTYVASGQLLVEPQLTLDGWTTSLAASKFKTDLDIKRLPSGKFDTNYLVCALAALAMNILRLLGQAGLHGPDAPVRHEAKRRRIKTVIQELIYGAGRLIAHGRSVVLGLGANDRSAAAFARLHGELIAAGG